ETGGVRRNLLRPVDDHRRGTREVRGEQRVRQRLPRHGARHPVVRWFAPGRHPSGGGTGCLTLTTCPAAATVDASSTASTLPATPPNASRGRRTIRSPTLPWSS